MGSKTPDFPDQSPQAAAAGAAQLEVLNSQRDFLASHINLQNLLTPSFLSSLGYDVQKDDKGNVTGIGRTKLGAQKDRAESLATNREIMALKGKLPVDSQTTQELDRQEAALREQLTRSLGPDYAASTAGQQALADFQQRRAIVIDSSARQDLTVAGGLVGQHQNMVDAAIQTALGVTQAPLTGIQVMGQNAAGYGSIVNSDNQLRGQQYQATLEANSSMWGGIGSLVGTIGGAMVGGPMGASTAESMSNGLFGGSGNGVDALFGDAYGG